MKPYYCSASPGQKAEMVERHTRGFQNIPENPTISCKASTLQEMGNRDVTPNATSSSNASPQACLSDDVARLILKIIDADQKGSLAENVKTALFALLEI